MKNEQGEVIVEKDAFDILLESEDSLNFFDLLAENALKEWQDGDLQED